MLSLSGVADQLGVSVRTVRRLVDAGMLHGVDISCGDERANWRFTQTDVDEFLAARRTGPAS